MRKLLPGKSILLSTLVLLLFFIIACSEKMLQRNPTRPISEEVRENYPRQIISVDNTGAVQRAAQIRREAGVELADDLQLSLWADDSLVVDPIAISIDPNGRIYYNRAIRLEHSEFDIRNHRDWMTASISWQTVEERRAFLRKTFASENEQGQRFLKDLNKDGTLDWRDLTVEKEQIWFITDKNRDGVAETAQLYLEDFNEEISDVANGIEYFNGEVFISIGPDLWRTKDVDGDGVADYRESISHGYAVHIGFGAHGMSGATIGPDGRIWWGIGDIGMNVVDQEGKRWKYPNQGVIVRSELDGSGFEVYSAGLRNTHEFTFDKYGNLISVDNDGDHRGERERLVYLINGSDGGWRINWQFGKYTDPANNSYKVWMEERLHIPRWDGQAAYILPPIVNYVNGPTGLVYNPGTALSPRWNEHFFVAEFRGTPAASPIHAFTLKPSGASFELDRSEIVVKGLLPTGLDFAPDGALYFGDWITGWRTKSQGRIWKLDVADEAKAPIRQETEDLIAADVSAMAADELAQWLRHADMRIRRRAQFELAQRGRNGFEALHQAARQPEHQLARIHGLWGIGQMARQQDRKYARTLQEFLKDDDSEIVTQAAKMLGDVRYAAGAADLIPLLKHNSLRVQLHATEALGRIGYPDAVEPILEMLLANNDQDTWLRHAGMIALARIGREEPLAALEKHPAQALRIAAVVALRRMQSPAVARFLQDEDEYIVTEAARAINDDFSIEAALPDLAVLLEEKRFGSEPLLRRAISANSRLGSKENVEILTRFATDPSRPPEMRAEALAALSNWAKPSVHDRVDGRYRGEVMRDAAPVIAALQPEINELLNDSQPAVQVAALHTVAKLDLQNSESSVMTVFENNPSNEVRIAALRAMHLMKSGSLDKALTFACADTAESLRSAALEIIPDSNLGKAQAVSLFGSILKTGGLGEQQAALAALGTIDSEDARRMLAASLDGVITGSADPAIHLDIIEAVERQTDAASIKKLNDYRLKRAKVDSLAPYLETLAGGDSQKGQDIFYNNEAAQCVRCHSIFEHGGNAGPNLADVGVRMSDRQIMQSLVEPSAELAAGYEGAPSSMPPMKYVLTPRQIRDVIAFLKGLKGE